MRLFAATGLALAVLVTVGAALVARAGGSQAPYAATQGSPPTTSSPLGGSPGDGKSATDPGATPFWPSARAAVTSGPAGDAGSRFDGSYEGAFDGTVSGSAMPVSLPFTFQVTNAEIVGDGFRSQVDANGMAAGTAPFSAYGLQCTYVIAFSAKGTVTTPGTISCTNSAVTVSGVLNAHRVSA